MAEAYPLEGIGFGLTFPSCSSKENRSREGTCRNDGTAPGKGQFAPDVESGRLRPWWEKGLKKWAIARERTILA
jgi:hypothetical protein